MATLGENIKQARIAAHMTQDELAGLLGTTKSTISKYELGHREPNIATINKISHLLGVSSGYLINGESLVSQVNLACGVHIYRRQGFGSIDLSVLSELPENSYTVRYRDTNTLIVTDRDSDISDEDLQEIIDSYTLPLFGSELQLLIERESRRLGVPVNELKHIFLEEKTDIPRVPLNEANLTSFFNKHVAKRVLKKIVENSPNWPDHVKEQIKLIVDAGHSPQEICENTFAYLATLSIIQP